MSNTNDFSKCKVGDKLWHRIHKEITVLTNTATSATISFLVDGDICYANKIQDSEDQVLFFSKPQIIAPEEPVRNPEIAVGTLLEVWDGGALARNIIRFGAFVETEKSGTYVRAYGESKGWGNYKLAPETIRIRELEEELAKLKALVMQEDGWIPFEATEDSVCPVEPDAKVIVKRRNFYVDIVREAGFWEWKVNKVYPKLTIVAYKVVA